MTKAKSPLRGHVLVVEQESGTRGVIVRTLTSAGATCEEASSAKDALEALAERAADILVVALSLEGAMSGAALTRALKSDSRLKGLPVLMLAPRSSPDDVMACLDAGCDDVVAKPFIGPS